MYLCSIYITLISLFAIGTVKTGYKLKQIKLPKTIFPERFRIFTDDDLLLFDGSSKGYPVYISVRGIVFDVTAGKDFYGKGAPYNALAGKDASRAVALMSLNPDDLNNNLEDLSDEHLKALDEVFEGTYLKKYPVVGCMDYEDEYLRAFQETRSAFQGPELEFYTKDKDILSHTPQFKKVKDFGTKERSAVDHNEL